MDDGLSHRCFGCGKHIDLLMLAWCEDCTEHGGRFDIESHEIEETVSDDELQRWIEG